MSHKFTVPFHQLANHTMFCLSASLMMQISLDYHTNGCSPFSEQTYIYFIRSACWHNICGKSRCKMQLWREKSKNKTLKTCKHRGRVFPPFWILVSQGLAELSCCFFSSYFVRVASFKSTITNQSEFRGDYHMGHQAGNTTWKERQEKNKWIRI